MIWDVLNVLFWVGVAFLGVFVLLVAGMAWALIWKMDYKLKRTAYLRGETKYNPDKTESTYLPEPLEHGFLCWFYNWTPEEYEENHLYGRCGRCGRLGEKTWNGWRVIDS